MPTFLMVRRHAGRIILFFCLDRPRRDTVREALAARGAAPPRALLSAGLVGAVTALAMKLTDLGLVAGISGAIVSTGISYILPSIMFGQMLASKVRLGRPCG